MSGEKKFVVAYSDEGDMKIFQEIVEADTPFLAASKHTKVKPYLDDDDNDDDTIKIPTTPDEVGQYFADKFSIAVDVIEVV